MGDSRKSRATALLMTTGSPFPELECPGGDDLFSGSHAIENGHVVTPSLPQFDEFLTGSLAGLIDRRVSFGLFFDAKHRVSVRRVYHCRGRHGEDLSAFRLDHANPHEHARMQFIRRVLDARAHPSIARGCIQRRLDCRNRAGRGRLRRAVDVGKHRSIELELAHTRLRHREIDVNGFLRLKHGDWRAGRKILTEVDRTKPQLACKWGTNRLASDLRHECALIGDQSLVRRLVTVELCTSKRPRLDEDFRPSQ
ncbi:MAG: hypothetical protein QM784_32110 [Polyangiaceae bacterium]